MSITFTITATNDIKSFNEVDLSPALNTTLTINSITDTERPGDTIANDSFRFEWYIVDKPESSNASIVLIPGNDYKSSIVFNSIDTWGTYRIFVTANNINTGSYSETNLFVANESHFINLSVVSTNNSLEKPAATQRDWNTIYSRLTEVVDSTTKSINQVKVASDKTFTLPVVYGTSGQVLTTAGDGNLSWQDASGGGGSLAGLTSNGSDTLTLGQGYNINTQQGTINDVAFNLNNGALGKVLVHNGSGSVVFASVSQLIQTDSGQETLVFDGGRRLDILGGTNATTSIATSTDAVTITVNATSSGGSSLSGLTSVAPGSATSGTLTIDNNYNLLRSGTALQSGPDIGSATLSFGTIYASNLDATDSLLLGDVLYAATDGVQNAYLKTDGNGTTSFTQILSSEISDFSQQVNILATGRVTAADIQNLSNVNIPDENALTDGQILKWNDTENYWHASNENVKSYTITANGSSAFRITGPGLDGSVDNPDIYLTRGENYSFINDAGAAHPFNIQSISGVAYSTTGTGLSDNSLANEESATWEVAMTAPSHLRYQCSNHAVMLGNIYILDRASSSGSGLNNWTENSSGHIIPDLNSSYDIGSAENKVRHLFLSDNSLNIGDTNLSIGINDQALSTGDNKSLDLNISNISLKSYNFNSTQINPESIVSGGIYRIGNPGNGTIDFKLVGATSNSTGHIFEATADGTALTNDGIAYLNQSQSIHTRKNYIYTETNDVDNEQADLKYLGGMMPKTIVAVSSSGIADNSVLSYTSGEWYGQSIHDLTRKSWHASHNDSWTTSLSFVANGQKYAAQGGKSNYIFSFYNNTGGSLVIKKITLTCSEMYSPAIKWSASFANNVEFLQNISETLAAISATVSMTQDNKVFIGSGNSIGIGFSEWSASSYDATAINNRTLQPDHFLLISINEMEQIVPVVPALENKKFTATVYYA